MAARHHGRELAAHDHAHQVQHFVVEDFAVLDGALQRFLRGDGQMLGCGGRGGDPVIQFRSCTR